MRELTVTEKDCAQQLIKYLSKYMEEAPKSFFYKMLRKKNIVLNQKKADGSENVYVVTCFSDRDKILSQVVKEA